MEKSNRCRLAAALAALALAATAHAQDNAVRVFPVQGVFWDRQEAAIDQSFLRAQDIAALSEQVRAQLAQAFAGRTGELTQRSAANTFTVSLHLTRMATYTAPKADGNIEVRTPVTGSIYFSNVLTGEILYSVTGTNAAVALVSGKGGAVELQRQVPALYSASLQALIQQLSKQAAQKFQPQAVTVQVGALHQDMPVLTAGYRQGVQSGDSLEDADGNLLRVVYAGEDYALAQKVLAGRLAVGMSFHKYVTGKVDGRLRPRATVIVDTPPPGFSREYLGQLLSEEMAQKAPLTVVQVNRNFAELLTAVGQQATLSTSSLARRDPPDLLVRLHVSEPRTYEVRTNLAARTVRHFEARAQADVLDTTGRILFSAVGSDHQKIEVNAGLDLDPQARREIAVKNALLDLADQLGKLAAARPERSQIAQAGAGGMLLAATSRRSPGGTAGTVLRTTPVTLGGKRLTLALPLGEATAGLETSGAASVDNYLPLTKAMPSPGAGDQFETLQLGALPKSAAATTLCSDSENLGSIATPELTWLAVAALTRAMPASLYTSEVRASADALIQPTTGFREALRWSIPATPWCVQPVQRVDAGTEECGEQCQRQVTARYTLRLRLQDKVAAREGLEAKFRSSGYEKATAPAAVQALLQTDLQDEAQKLLNGVADKLVFPTTP